MSNIKIIDVKCKHGHVLFGKYRKLKSGSLLKCYIDEIGVDHVGVSGLANETDIFCPRCRALEVEVRIGRIGMVHGRPAVIVNHGGIQPVRT